MTNALNHRCSHHIRLPCSLDLSEKMCPTTSIKVEIIDRTGKSHVVELPTDIELNMMEVCTAAELPINSLCGGLALCGHCHVYVESDHVLPHLSDQESITLDKLVHVKPNSRLACRIKVNEEMNGLKLQLAPVE